MTEPHDADHPLVLSVQDFRRLRSRKAGYTEVALQRAVSRLLDYDARVVWHARVNCGQIVIPYQTKGGQRKQRVFVGFPKGTLDRLLLLPDGRYAFLELKMPGEKLTPAQQGFIDFVHAAGGQAAIASSLDEVNAFLLTLESSDDEKTQRSLTA
jgi:hypothetical protein